MSEEMLDVLDDLGRVVDVAPRSVVHARGLPHHAVHVLVRDDDGRLLMQLRSSLKRTSPGLWDTSVGGHVGAGEDLLESALRETREELGIVVAARSLRVLPSHVVELDLDRERVSSWELVHPGPFAPDPREVERVEWFTRDQVREMVGNGVCTPHFEAQWRAWLESHMAR